MNQLDLFAPLPDTTPPGPTRRARSPRGTRRAPPRQAEASTTGPEPLALDFTASPTPSGHQAPAPTPDVSQDRRLWQLEGWTVRVSPAEEDHAWAVEVKRHGEAEPVLLQPWSTLQDSTEPRPLDRDAVEGLIRCARDNLQRSARQLRAMLHRQVNVSALNRDWAVHLDIVPDEYDPHATLTALDADGEAVARVRVSADFRLTPRSASQWIRNGFRTSEALCEA